MSDLFSILCTTCQSPLRVRDTAIIGKILACPKCSSMVLVEAPAGWAPPISGETAKPQSTPSSANESNGNGASHNVSAAMKSSRSATPAPLPIAKAIAPTSASTKPGTGLDPSSLKETMSDSHFADVEVLFGGGAPKPSPVAKADPTTKPKSANANADKRRDTPAPPPPAEMKGAALVATVPPKPTVDSIPTRTRRARMIGLLTIGGLMGISLAISAAYFAVTWNSTPKAIAEGTPQTPAVNPEEVPPETPPAVPEPPIDSAPPSTESADTDPPTVPPKEPTPTEQPPEETTSPLPKDPLDIVNDVPRQPGNDPFNLNGLAKQLRGLEGDSGPMPGETAPADESVGTPAVPEVPEAPPSRARPEPRTVDLPARLADRLVEAEFTGQPLAEVLQFLSDFSTIPITLDPEALAWSKITPAAPVHAQLSNATLEEVLKEVLKPFRLEAVPLESQLVVTRSPVLRTIKCPIDDLAKADPARQELIDLIMALAAPDTWKSAGGLGSLTPQGSDLLVENTELAYGDVLHVCERLRQARGGRTKSVFPPELFALERRSVRAAAKLDLPLTLNFGQPTQFVKILNRFAEETGTHIVVDWQAAGEVGWPPDADATVTVDKTPLREALAKLLTPMDLTYRVVDAKTLQITTPHALLRKPDLEAYKADDLANSPAEAAALIERVTAELGEKPVLRWDEPSKTLLALLPQPQQEKLAGLLDSWRVESAPESEK